MYIEVKILQSINLTAIFLEELVHVLVHPNMQIFDSGSARIAQQFETP